MNGIAESLNGWSEVWATWVLLATVQSTLVAVVLLGLAALLRRKSSPLRYGILMVALLKFVAPPLVSVAPGLFGLAEHAPASFSTAIPSALSDLPFLNSQSIVDDAVPLQAAPGGATTPIPKPDRATPSLSIQSWLMLAHGAGALGVVFWMGFHIRRLHRSIREGRIVRDGLPLALLLELCESFGVRKVPRLVILPDGSSPAAYGVLKRTILLPSSLASSSPQSLRIVLAHELAHFRRFDLWVNWLQLLLLAAWWFNPVYWLVSKRVRQTREECCDDLLLSRGIADGEAYSTALLDVANQISARTPVGAALGFAEKLHPLGRRIKRLMDPTLTRAPGLSILGLCGLIVMSVLVLPGVKGEAEDSDPVAAASAVEETQPPVSAQPLPGGIQGQVFVGGKPAAGVEIVLHMTLACDWGAENPMRTTTGADGVFQFHNLGPGHVELGRRKTWEVATGKGTRVMKTGTNRIPAQVVSGATTEVTLGAGGRTIQGRLTWPDESMKGKIAFTGGDRRYLYQPVDPKSPAAVASTYAYLAVLDIQPDGTFTVEDVPPGTYTLDVSVRGANADPSGPELGGVKREIVVPEGMGAHQLGAFKLGPIQP